MTKNLIVGIDTGTTVGIAILDIYGNIVNLSSKRGATKSDLIKHILKFGEPIIIASDVNPLSKSIEKLSSMIGSTTYYPKKSLTNKEKLKIIKEYKKEIKDSHQKDALAAALKAFRNYHGLFIRIDEIVTKLHRKDIFDKVVKAVVTKRTESIINVVKKILMKKK